MTQSKPLKTAKIPGMNTKASPLSDHVIPAWLNGFETLKVSLKPYRS